MSNGLFDFDFVDRKNERKKISDFIDHKNESNVLWINGTSGVGKSYLIQNTAFTNKSFHTVLVSPQAQSQTDISLKIFITRIESLTGIDFLIFVKNNYLSVIDIVKGLPNTSFTNFNANIDWFLNIAFDSTKLFVNNKNEKQSASKLIIKYIDFILKEGNCLLIILDNFTYCDAASQTILLDVLKTYFKHDNIKFIIATTQEELEKQHDLKVVLLEKLETNQIYMKGFNDAQCFKQILENKFVVNAELNELIEYIYKYCRGIPELLKEILRNLALKNSIVKSDSSEKAQIKTEYLKNYLLNININELPEIDFKLINEIESFFLQTITYIKYPVSFGILKQCFPYLTEKLFGNSDILSDGSFVFLINKYIGLDVFNCEKTIHGKIVSFKHDLLYLKFREHFLSYINKEEIYHYLYRFVCDNSLLIESILGKECFYSMKAYYSYEADDDEWININYQLGLKKYEMSLFYDAIDLFQRLRSKTRFLKDKQQLIIANCYYDVGEYNQCSLILKMICVDKLNKNEKYKFYLTWGKVLFVKLDALSAVDKIDMALKNVACESEYYKALALKLTALAETHGGAAKARQIFDEDIAKLVSNPTKISLIGDVLRNCWTYCTGQSAITYLNKALQLSQKEGNVIDMAYTYNNLGLEYVRGWELSQASSAYKKSLELLDNIKKHETSYPLNNLAVIEMLNKNYSDAFDYLLEANLWNRSPFMQYVIKTHMLVCNYYLNNIENANKISDELYKHLFCEKIQDENTIRKISLNLSIFYWNTKRNEEAKKCILYLFDYIKDSYSEYRGTIYYNLIMNTSKPLSDIKYSSSFFQIIEFEPWLATLSHQ